MTMQAGTPPPSRADIVGPRWRGRDWIGLLICAGCVALVQGWIALGARSVMGAADAMYYVLLAEHYRSVFDGASPAAWAEIYRTTHFPPLFPLLLGLAGAGSDSQWLAQAMTGACAVLATVLAWTWARVETGSAAAASVVGLALALNPGFFLVTLNPMSEPLALALCLCALLHARSAVSNPGRLPLTALIVALATLARSACLSLVAALFVWLIQHRARVARAVALASCAAAPLGAWMLHRQAIQGSVSYLQSLAPELMLEAMGGWPGLLYLQPFGILKGLAENLDPRIGAVALAAAALLMLAALAGAAHRWRRGHLDGSFLFAYFLLLLVWPYPSEVARLVAFALPVLLLAALEGMTTLARCLFRDARFASGLAAALLAIVLAVGSLPTLARFAARTALPVDAALEEHKREQVFFLASDDAEAVRVLEMIETEQNTIREAGRRVPVTDCVYAVEPALLQLQGGLKSVPYPRRLDDLRPASAQLDRCRFHYTSASSYAGGNYAGFHLVDALRQFTEPVLVARLRIDGVDTPVAALLERRAPGAPPRDDRH